MRDISIKIAQTITISLIWGLLAPAGCCDNHDLKLFRIRGFLDGVASVLEEVELDTFSSYHLQGSVGDWAGVPLVDEQRIDVNTADFAHFTRKIDWDIDQDGSKETVEILAAVNASEGEAVYTFLAWEGDRYTLDSNLCYLGYTEGDETFINAAECDSHLGTMTCTREGSGETPPVCQRCNASWQCRLCNLEGTFEKCVPEEPSSGDIDIDIDVDIDFDL